MNARIVAHYGGPQDPRLGPHPAAGSEPGAGAGGFGDRRAADPCLPAHRHHGDTGPRSPRPPQLSLDPGQVQPYLGTVRTIGGLLVLDIQPGRSDFLTELLRHETFLAEPDVGVGLDPEWRMHAHEPPADPVGHVDADEVNAVSAYLAELVERYRLPEKLLVLHQFQPRMVRHRDHLQSRDGLAITIHMDGFGTRDHKLESYHNVRADPPLRNGMKVFVEQDTNPFTLHETLRLDPPPFYISYQ